MRAIRMSQVEGADSLSADVVIVGTGAGGSMAFHDLATAGHDVIALELGEHLFAEDMLGREELMLPRLFAEGGGRATDDFSVSILQGKGVGGSTLHNTNLCKRLPEPLRAIWAREYGLRDLLDSSLDDDFADVEKMLDVHRIPDDRINANNAVLERGIAALGYAGGRLKHNRKLCQQSGMCELGCPNDGKENAARVLIPPALQAGGRLFDCARVDHIITERGRAAGVSGHAIDPETGLDVGRFEVKAKHVVLAGSATSSAALARRSAIDDPHSLTGTNLHMHPGAIVVGFFEEKIEGWLGTPQAVECTEFLEFGHDAQKRVWIVSGFAHPGAAAGFLPGFGPDHAALMAQYPHVSVLIVMLHDHCSGRVSPGERDQVFVDYSLDRSEYEQLALGLRESSRLMLAGGASKVMVPTRPAKWIHDEGDIARIEGRELGPVNPPLTAVHPMSTMWMGNDPENSVVDPGGQHHQVKGLWVADGSLFPTSIGGPPQISIYTFGRRVARELATRL